MDPLRLKFTILTTLVFIDVATWTQGVPLRRESRSSVVDWTNYNYFEPQGRGSYAFGYDVEDPESNNIQYRDEERHPNGTVTGSYGYLRPDGLVHIVHYVADDKGYRASVENNQRGQLKQPGISFQPEASSLSPAMVSALQAEEVYKKQNIHDQRLRPIDVAKGQNLRAATTSPFFPNSYEEQVNNAYKNDFHESLALENYLFNDYGRYENPYRFFMNRK